MAFVRVEDQESIRTVTLQRPERRNALLPDMLDSLTAAFRSAGGSGARVLVLRGEGEAFCAGLDVGQLRAMADRTAAEHNAEAARVAATFQALWECDLPTIAVVQGAAVAGGTGLATLCDFTLAAPGTRFGYTEARIGFVPALVSAYLRLQVGDKAARGLLLSARLFDAADAQRLGLVTEVVPHEQMEERLAALLQMLLSNAPDSLRATKQLLREQQRSWLDHALTLATEANAASRGTADFREGVAAFLDKREPSWKPRH